MRFGTLPELHPFEDQFFLFTHIHLEVQATVFSIGNIIEGRCVELFPKY